jgi:hypothetical protein
VIVLRDRVFGGYLEETSLPLKKELQHDKSESTQGRGEDR